MAGAETRINAMRSQEETAWNCGKEESSIASLVLIPSPHPHAFAQHSRGQTHDALFSLGCVPLSAEESQASQMATQAGKQEVCMANKKEEARVRSCC